MDHSRERFTRMPNRWLPRSLAGLASLMFLLCLVSPSFADGPPPPAYLSLPAQAQLKPTWIEEDYGEAAFIIIGESEPRIQAGKHWSAACTLSGVPNGMDVEEMWQKLLKPSLVQGGWVFFRDAPGQAKTARYQKNGKDGWVLFWVNAPDDIRFDLVEVGAVPARLKVTLQKPAAKRETVDLATGDFPYLAPMPGITPQPGSQNEDPMLLDVDINKTDHETRVVAPSSVSKSYAVPQALQSPLLIFTVYHDALIQAGWTIVHHVQSITGGDMVINAHYAANGRDIWAMLHGGGDSFTIQVGDNGAQDLAKQLDQDCHVALYGLNFDFNKATLRPDSDPVLQKVLALLKSRPDLKLEVQGHTDNVGSDDYNLKLSDARAASVAAWLVSKGITADRLTAQGYGMRQPIADNGSDEGRAKNRRVELRKQGCSK